MLQKMDDLLQKRKKARLYRQWMANSGLPTEEIPPELHREPRERLAPASEDAFAGEKEAPADSGDGSQQSIDLRVVNQYIRYVFLLWLTITVLLVLLAIAATLLITQ